MKKDTPKKVLIVGGGFGGINAAQNLARISELQITLIDKRNHHLFQPLLYQVATAGLSPADIAAPIRNVLAEHDNVSVILGEVENVNLKEKSLTCSGHTLPYDYLILACGSSHSYFGHNEWEPFAPGLKSIEQATEIRRRVLLSFELAEMEKDSDKKKALQTFVVIGAGPTGVELAGALGEMCRYTLSEDFKHIDPKRNRILLIEAGPRILPSFPKALTDHATSDLENLGVSVWTNCKVTEINERGVKLGEDFIESSCVLWAAGVQSSPLNEKVASPKDRRGRIVVNDDLSLPEHPEVFAIGDQAQFKSEKFPEGLPGLAPVAIQQGKHLKKIFSADLKGHARPPFHYLDKGQMATVGRKKAIVESAGLKVTGTWAWLMWLFVHVYYLIGFKNRLFVFLQWTWSYFTFKRGARLIINKEWRSFKS